MSTEALPGVLGSWGESLCYFQGTGRNSNYLKGAREQALNLRKLGSTVKKSYGLASGRLCPIKVVFKDYSYFQSSKLASKTFHSVCINIFRNI